MTNEELVNKIQQGVNTSCNMESLYINNKPYMFQIAKKYMGYADIEDLMQEAYFGLYEAVQRYDNSYETLFMTYAAFWIKHAVKRYLDNCGRTIRISVHKQEKIYKYNQVTSYYLHNFDREPTNQEYARSLGVSAKTIEGLEKSMFQGFVKSLDAPLTGGEDESITLADSVSSGENLENDVIEKLTQEQLHKELWEIVCKVLRDDKKVQIMKWKYIDNITLEEIGDKLKVSKADIGQLIRQSINRIRCNAKTRRLGVKLGLWKSDKPMNIDMIKIWANSEHISYLDDKELKYAKRMEWI